MGRLGGRCDRRLTERREGGVELSHHGLLHHSQLININRFIGEQRFLKPGR